MESLVTRAQGIELRGVALPNGAKATIQTLRVAFAGATPARLAEGILPRTYTAKPLVSVDGDAMFGELAILRWLEKDGWSGAWVDTFHGGKFWNAMPHKSAPIALPLQAQNLYDEIKRSNGGKGSGAFDVMAWRRDQFVFLEYKGAGDNSNTNEARWIEAALAAGVAPGQLWFVVHPLGHDTAPRKMPRTTTPQAARMNQPSNKLHRRTIADTLKREQRWEVKSRVDGTIDVEVPASAPSAIAFIDEVRAAIEAMGYSPTLRLVTASGQRMIQVSTPETLEQRDRGAH